MQSKQFIQVSMPNGELKTININQIAMLEQVPAGTIITMNIKTADGENAVIRSNTPYVTLSVQVYGMDNQTP
jgi:hypothetical protein